MIHRLAISVSRGTLDIRNHARLHNVVVLALARSVFRTIAAIGQTPVNGQYRLHSERQRARSATLYCNTVLLLRILLLLVVLLLLLLLPYTSACGS